MKCRECGQPVEPGWRACAYCGTPLTQADMPPVRPPDNVLLKTNQAQDGVILDKSSLHLHVEVDADSANSSAETQANTIASLQTPEASVQNKRNQTDNLPYINPLSGGTGIGTVIDTSNKVIDGVLIDRRTFTIIQNPPQEVKIPGKYSMVLFSVQSSFFPAYRATAGDGRNLVAKLIGKSTTTTELNRFIGQQELDKLPKSITRYLPAEEINGEVLLLREYCQGQSLVDYARDKGVLLDREIMGILTDVTRPLVTLTRRPHGSLKPQNIFLDFVGNKRYVSLADFAIYSVRDFLGAKDREINEKANRFNKIDSYSSIQGAPLPPAERDCYALGIIAFELMGCNLKEPTGAPPQERYFTKYRKMPDEDFWDLLHDLVFTRKIKSVYSLHSELQEIIG